MIALKRWLAPLGLAFFLAGCGQEKLSTQPEIALSGSTMGTYYSVKVVGEGLPKQETLQQAIQAALDGVDERMSTYNPNSELSHFNQHQSTRPFMVSDEIAGVVAEALRVGRDTQGALDITVGPLVNLWGFGPDKKRETAPSETEIAAAKARTGLAQLSVITSLRGSSLQKENPAIYLDLSSTAKGYAVDEVAERLEQLGVSRYLVEVGGELRVKGSNSKGLPWRVAIEKPQEELGAGVQQVIAAGENGIATSGDYRNYFEQKGKRYSHTIDPITGKPITHNLASITVIHPSCMTADALATGLNVLGAEKALSYAESQQLPIYMIIKSKKGFEVKMSSAFKRYLVEQK